MADVDGCLTGSDGRKMGKMGKDGRGETDTVEPARAGFLRVSKEQQGLGAWAICRFDSRKLATSVTA